MNSPRSRPHQTMKTPTRLFRRLATLITLLPLAVLAYPPAPGILVHGTVRGTDGFPVEDPQAKILFQSSERLLATTSLIPDGLDSVLSNNYQVILPVDMNPARGAYREDVVGEQLPFTVTVKLGDQLYVPIESSVGLEAPGEAASVVRLDFTFGSDSDGDGIPDEWEYWLLEAAGYGPGSPEWNLDQFSRDGDADGDGVSDYQEYLNGTYAIEIPDPVEPEDVFDPRLAQTLDINTTPGPFQPGDPISFRYEISNDGNVTAQNIVISQTIPEGFVLFDNTWTESGNTATRTLAGPLSPGDAETLTAGFILAQVGTGSVTLVSEIASAENIAGESQTIPNPSDPSPLVIMIDPPDPTEPQPIPSVALTRTRIGPVTADNMGVYRVLFEYSFANIGEAVLDDIELSDDLWTKLPGAAVATAIDGSFAANPVWNGAATANLLASGQQLAPGEQGSVRASYRFTPAAPGRILSTARITANAQGSQVASTASSESAFDIVFASLGNLVWLDENYDGLRQSGEPGIAGVDVELRNIFEQTLATTRTDGNGEYTFPDLLPLSYSVHLPAANFASGGALAGMRSSVPTEPQANLNGDNNDNGLETGTPISDGVSSGSIQLQLSDPANTSLDFGFWALPSLGGSTWIDANNNLLPDEIPDQFGIDGVRVDLFAVAPNGTETFLKSTRSVASLYRFDRLEPGVYRVEVDTATVPTAFELPTTPTRYTTTLVPNDQTLNLHFGFVTRPTAIELERFEATVVEQGVRLEWTTAWEQDLLGFNVYQVAADGGLKQVNQALVLGGVGAYAVTESGATGGRYVLEEISSNLDATTLDPVAYARVDASPLGIPTLHVEAEDELATFTSSEDFDSYLVSGFRDPPRVLDLTELERPRLLIGEILGDEVKSAYFSVEPDRAILVE